VPCRRPFEILLRPLLPAQCLFVVFLPFLAPFLRIETNKTAGTDAKSIAINLASLLLFVLPFALYYCKVEEERQQEGEEETTIKVLVKTNGYYASIGVVVAAFAVAVLLPPVGWKRPHPYSDMPANRPAKKKS